MSGKASLIFVDILECFLIPRDSTWLLWNISHEARENTGIKGGLYDFT